MTVPPHDLSAERSVIGAMMVSENAASLVTDILCTGDFYSETHRIIWDACTMLSASGVPVDRITVSDALKDSEQFERVGGESYVYQLVESMPTAANANRYAKIVRDHSVMRDLANAGDIVAEMARNQEGPASDVIERAEDMIYSVSRQSSEFEGFVDIGRLTADALQEVQDLYEQGAEVTGLPTGFRDIDSLLGGMHPGDLNVLAARPAFGKTSLALDITANVAEKNNPVAWFSLEMSKEQLAQRLISRESRISLSDIRSGKIPANSWPDLVRATAKVGQLPVHIDDSAGTSVAGMRGRLRRLLSRNRSGIGLVVVDYLQLVSPSKGSAGRNRNDEVAAISRNLKILARDFKVPVLAISQLSRSCEARQDKRPMLSDLRDSGSIENDADWVGFLYNDEYYNPDSEYRGEVEFNVAKHRNGPIGKVQLAFSSKRASFSSLAKHEES